VSVLIKAANGGGAIQPFSLRRSAAAAATPIEMPPQDDPRLAMLRHENSQLRQALAELRDGLPGAEAKAREQGKREGVAGAQADDRKRLETLCAAVEAASASWTDRLERMDGLAATVARTALAKMFERSEDMADLVVRLIARQVELLRRETMIAVRVSSRDFPNNELLVIHLDRSEVWVCLLIEAGALAKLVKGQVGSVPTALKLQSMDVGLARQPVALAALLGRCELSVADLSGLTAGDVLVLDRKLDELLDLSIDGRPKAGRCAIEQVGSGLALKVVEPISG